MSNRKYIVFLGCPGFPHGLAEIQKIILISKCLVLTGNHVTVIGNKGSHYEANHPDLKAHGNYENIEYIYTSGNPFRSNSFVKRNLSKVKGAINEVLLLKRRKNNNKLTYAVLSTQSFYAVVFYSLLAKLFGFKTILNYVEFFSGIEKKSSQLGRKLNDKLYDKYAPLLCDGIFPISEFLIDHIKKISPGKEYLKIPGLTEFERYDGIETLPGQQYFLFCGAANYQEVIRFIIDAFGRLRNTSVFLYLVINGNEQTTGEIKNYVSNSPQKDRIKFFSKLTERQLYTNYKNAMALLIPLRPNFQDIARFPHKFGEYLASGNPVISTNYGEVKKYFTDMDNMLIADKYDMNLFADKMQFVIDNPGLVKEIGVKGKKAASSIFDYRVKATDIDRFLNKLNQ
jgi:glycosyltransferase involved in cell wall biosynthesis